jgi:hypothetical protein
VRGHSRSAGSAAIATVPAVALTMGPTSPASATSERVTAVPGVTGPAGVTGAGSAVSRRITLVTGDRVLVDREGRVLGLERAKGRSGCPRAAPPTG